MTAETETGKDESKQEQEGEVERDNNSEDDSDEDDDEDDDEGKGLLGWFCCNDAHVSPVSEAQLRSIMGAPELEGVRPTVPHVGLIRFNNKQTNCHVGRSKGEQRRP